MCAEGAGTMARPQVEVFLQIEFKRLAQEAGVKGARIHVERAIAADYEQVIREVAPCLRSATAAAPEGKVGEVAKGWSRITTWRAGVKG